MLKAYDNWEELMNIIFLIKPKCETAFLYCDDSIRQGLEKMHYHHFLSLITTASIREQ